MYKRLAKVLFRTRESLHSACAQLDINPEDLDPQLMLLLSCDNCGYWEKEINLTSDTDGTLYCSACDFAENQEF